MRVRRLAYDASQVEARAQSRFRQEQQQHAASSAHPKRYILSMFPYPSGALHMGHVRVYAYGDCLARFHRLQGRRVMFPIGWDSFGLPAENAARERKLDPRDWTESNIAHMKQQLEALGLSFDWEREISTCRPDYFRWTQWLFLRLRERGLAYQAEAMVNWDPVDQTVLANEQVDANGCSWRSGAVVEQRKLRQWFFGITKYAQPLLEGLDSLPGWPVTVKKLQELWIGRSEGMYVDFGPVRVFTTCPETIMGVSFVAMSHEHRVGAPDLVPHPLTGAILPVLAADYVFADYGTGAVMGVPGHDERDAKFAVEKNLPTVRVVSRDGATLVNSGAFSGMSVSEGREAICKELERKGSGKRHVTYKLRDWLVSRQRPWGAPIPMVHCASCAAPVPVKESDLPVPLAPRDDPAAFEQWRNCACPACGGPAVRDTDTMDTFVDSSWYYLRYTDPHSTVRPCDAASLMPVDTYIGGVEHAVLHLLYARFINRFLHQEGWSPTAEPFTNLLTQGMVQSKTFRLADGNRPVPEADVDAEKLLHKTTGAAVKVSWEKMSKSKLNGVDPQAMVATYGADATRLYVLFRAPPHMALEWDESGIQGMKRWLGRLWQLVETGVTAEEAAGATVSKELDDGLREAVVQVTADLEQRFAFNTAIAALMTLSNVLRKLSPQSARGWSDARDALFIMMSPLAPHVADEAWHVLHGGQSVFSQSWPVAQKGETVAEAAEAVTVTVLVDGKKRAALEMSSEVWNGGDKEAIMRLARLAVPKFLPAATEVQMVVVARSKMVNLVTSKS